MVVIRKFEERDAEAVGQIMYDSFKSFLGDLMKDDRPQPREYWLRVSAVRTQDTETVSFVAETDGRVVGYLNVSANNKFGLGTLHQIGVDPNCHAKGVGTALFQAAEEFWVARKMRKIYTCTSSINTRAQAYYRKMGFVQEGILKSHFFPGVDELQLGKFY